MRSRRRLKRQQQKKKVLNLRLNQQALQNHNGPLLGTFSFHVTSAGDHEEGHVETQSEAEQYEAHWFQIMVARAHNRPIVFAGPSGCGKATLAARLISEWPEFFCDSDLDPNSTDKISIMRRGTRDACALNDDHVSLFSFCVHIHRRC